MNQNTDQDLMKFTIVLIVFVVSVTIVRLNYTKNVLLLHLLFLKRNSGTGRYPVPDRYFGQIGSPFLHRLDSKDKNITIGTV